MAQRVAPHAERHAGQEVLRRVNLVVRDVEEPVPVAGDVILLWEERADVLVDVLLPEVGRALAVVLAEGESPRVPIGGELPLAVSVDVNSEAASVLR